MSWTDFAFIGLACAFTILLFRVIPVFALRGRDLPGWLSQALAFIPPAAFAALIANDLLLPNVVQTTRFISKIALGIILVATAIVIVVAIKTKSLVWCIVAGVGSYGLLMLL